MSDDLSFDDFLSNTIEQGLEKEKLATLQEKLAPTPPAAEPELAAPTPPVEVKEPVKELAVESDWKDALEFSKDLDKTPTAPKDAAEKYPEKPPGTVTENASKAWAALRHRATQADAVEAKAKELEAKIKEYETKLSGLEDKEIVPKDIWAQNQKQQEELTSTLKLTNLEATPEFKQVITQPMQQVRAAAKTLAERYNVPLRDIVNALEEPDADKQADMLSDIAETGQFKDKAKLDLFRYGDMMRDLNTKKGHLTANVAKTLETIEHHRKQAMETQKKQFETNWNTALERSWANLEKGIWAFKKSDTDQEWNKSLDDMKEMVRGVKYHELPMEKQGQILYQAAMVPRMLKALVEAKERIVSQEAALSKYRGTTPGAAAGGGAGGSNPPAPIDDALGFVEAMTR